MWLRCRQVDEATVVPVGVPAVVEQQRMQGGQRVTGLGPLVHPTSFLTPHHQTIIRLLAQPAADVAPLAPTYAIVGNPGCTGGEIGA